jgi:hypothetical protein
MKRFITFLAAALLAVVATQSLADEKQAAGAKADQKQATEAKKEVAAEPAQKTVAGEVVDTGCYLGNGARGEKHVSCATKCINQGMPMGLLTSDGALYLLTLNHNNADAYNGLKGMAGKNVSVTGTVMERAGMKGIDVAAFKPLAAAAGK